MLSKPVAVALLVIACLGAAGGGAYLAVRENSGTTMAAREAPVQPYNQPVAPVVDETEAVIDVPPPAAAPDAPQRAERPPVTARTARPATAPAARPAPVRTPERAAVPGPVETRERTTPAPSRTAAAAPPTVAIEPVRPPELEPVATVSTEPPLPPLRLFEDLVVPASSVVGLQIETPVSSERARLEDRVEARVLRDVTIDGRTAIPAGSRALGVVTVVERGGKLKARAQLGVRFHTLVLADGSSLPVRTDTIFREGDSPGAESSRKIGGAAAGGAILGAIIGGKKGAVIGGATGAAGGTAVVAAGERNPATLPVGAVVTVRLSEPLVVEVERR
jgi:hypothetical protein